MDAPRTNPDSEGNTVPVDTMTGYELRDLDHAYVGQLYEGKLVVDKTYGHAAYGCGYNPPYFGTDHMRFDRFPGRRIK
jgi:hypothetical protein